MLLSSIVISAVGLTCKAFLNSGLCSITVSNLPILLDALSSRRDGQGMVTVSNHLSTLDDPLTWGILPFENFTHSRTIRWILGASDIVFTNPLLSAFFRKGQVIETFRGDGIWQPALDLAIEKLNQGHWLHMFGEGKVYQPSMYPRTGGIAHLPRFKWGIGRIIMETDVPPTIIPMWLTGFDKLMPENRTLPYKFIPKLGVQLGVAFGDPIPADEILGALNILHRPNRPSLDVAENSIRHSGPSHGSELCRGPHIGKWMKEAAIRARGDFPRDHEGANQRVHIDEIRTEVTAIVRRAVEDLGRKTSGDTLDLPLRHQAGDDTGDRRVP